MFVRSLQERDIPTLKRAYQMAFAGFPWYEDLPNEEVDNRFQKQLNARGFEGLVGEESGTIIAANWWDSPLVTDIEAERGKELADFATNLLTDQDCSLFWERELLTHPDFQKRGFGTIIRTAFIAKIREENNSFLILTRMREDNIPTIRIAEKLGYQPTGIKTPCTISDYLHEFWYLTQ